MKRPSPCRAFTLIEMLVVMAVIAILTGLILSLNGLIQNTGARNRAAVEIRALSAAIEGYKADNGGYPQSSTATDTLDPTKNFDASAAVYNTSSIFLWQQLSGHLNDLTPTSTPTGTNYAADFFKGSVLSQSKATNPQVICIQDPFGYSYGYSTAGLMAEQSYRKNLLQSGSGATRTPAGYNPTFDLWSTAGSTISTGAPKWVKNW